jgi:hypothetical protein
MAEDQPSVDQPSEVEWTEEAKPFAICMSCNTDYPESESVCPTCNLKLLIVHRCPHCLRIAALKHLRCPYCAWRFIKGQDLEETLEPDAGAAAAAGKVQRAAAHKLRQRNALVFSVVVFMAVFGVATWVIRYQSRRSPVLSVMGSSYVLQALDVRHSASEQTFPLGKLGSGTVVQITGIEQDERGSDWYQIRHNDGLGYVRVNELAPPKGANADGGYRLLKVSLSNLSDPSEIGEAGRAVDLYRRTYPGDPRGDEVLWLLAARAHELARRSRSHETISAARKAYEQLAAANGEYSSRARDALQQLPEPAPARGSRTTGKPALEIIGASTVGPTNKQTLPHTMMVLNQTRVLVNVPTADQFQTGQLLTAHVVGDVMTNNEVAIPGGSPCSVKVTAVSDPSATEGWVGLQLQSVEVGNRSYPVDAMPVRLSIANARLQSRPPVLFVLRRSLVLSR